MENETSSRNKKREMKSFEDSNKARKIISKGGVLDLKKSKDGNGNGILLINHVTCVDFLLYLEIPIYVNIY